jgi:hypothetical protein
MITPFRNELGKALVGERLREGQQARLGRTARMRTLSNRTWMSWWLSRFAGWTGATRSPQPARGVSDDMSARATVAPPARVRAVTAASRLANSANS